MFVSSDEPPHEVARIKEGHQPQCSEKHQQKQDDTQDCTEE